MSEHDTSAGSGRVRNEETGKYTYKYAPENYLDALREADGVAGTQEIADIVGSARQTAYGKLQQLEDDGKVRSKKPGHDLIWILTDDEE